MEQQDSGAEIIKRAFSHKLSRRRFFAAGAGTSAGLLLASCAGGGPQDNPAVTGGGGASRTYNGPPVTLQFWNGFTGGDGPYMAKLVKQFNAEQKNISVKMNTILWENYYQKVPAAVAAGQGPDLGIMHIDTLSTNAARNVIIPLDDVAAELNLEENDFAPVVWDAGIYNGSRYGIPLDMHPLGFYYNKTVMQEAGLDPNTPPQTESEYMSALEQMKAKGIQGYWVTPFLFTGVFQFESLLWQFGGELFNEDATEATFNSDAGVQALTWMVDAINKGYSPPNVGQDADMNAFQSDKNAFHWNGIWMINEFKKNPKLEWGVAPLPQIGTERAAWANSHNFVIMRQQPQDPNKLAAAKVFIAWISEHSLEWAKSGQVPARADVRESPAFQNLTAQSQFAKQVDYLHFLPPVPGIPDATATLEDAVNVGVLQKKSPQDALDDAAAQATELLRENAEKYQA